MFVREICTITIHVRILFNFLLLLDPIILSGGIVWFVLLFISDLESRNYEVWIIGILSIRLFSFLDERLLFKRLFFHRGCTIILTGSHRRCRGCYGVFWNFIFDTEVVLLSCAHGILQYIEERIINFFLFFFIFHVVVYIPATPRGRCLLTHRFLLLLHLDFVHHFWDWFLFFLCAFSNHVVRKVHNLLNRFQIILSIWFVLVFVRRITIIQIYLVSLLLRCLFRWFILTFLLLYELLPLKSRLLYLSWNDRLLFLLLRLLTDPWISHILFFWINTDLARLLWRYPGISKIFFVSSRLSNWFFYYLFHRFLFLNQLFFYLCLEELLLTFSRLLLGIFKLQLWILLPNCLRSIT